MMHKYKAAASLTSASIAKSVLERRINNCNGTQWCAMALYQEIGISYRVSIRYNVHDMLQLLVFHVGIKSGCECAYVRMIRRGAF